MKHRLEYAGLFFLFLMLGVSRRACQLQYPDVWAEDGIRIIPGIFTKGFASLFDPVNGYMVLVSRLLSFITLHISFYQYGLISSLLSFLLIATVAFAVATSPTILVGKRWCALAMLSVPSNPEVFGLPLYAFWWVSVLLFLVVLWDQDDSSPLLRIFYLLVGGLSSPVIITLLPLFYLRSYIYRAKPAEHIVSFLATAIAGFQLIFILSSGASRIPSLWSIIQYVLPKFFGSFLVGNIWKQATWVFALALVILIIVWMYDTRFRFRVSTVVVLPYLLAMSIALSVLRVDPAIIHQRIAGPRYFFYPYILLFWILIQIRFTRNRFSSIAGVFLVIAMLNAIPVWSRSHDDLHWKDHVLSSYFFPYYTFPVQYDGNRALAWSVSLSEQQYSAYHANDRFHDVRHDYSPVYPYTIRVPEFPGTHPFASVGTLDHTSMVGTDYSKSRLSGFQVTGTYGTSDADKGEITLTLHRGDCILFRSGAGKKGYRVIIAGHEKRFLQELPILTEWSSLEFSNRLLPERFSVKFVDDGGGYGEWFALALKDNPELTAPLKKEKR